MAIPSLDMGLDETLVALRDSVRAFCDKEIAPRAQEIDQTNAFPHDLWKKLGDLGVHGMTVAEEYGGVNMGYLAHIIVMEEISRASAAVGLSYGRPFQPLHQPDPPQRQRRAKGEISPETGRR